MSDLVFEEQLEKSEKLLKLLARRTQYSLRCTTEESWCFMQCVAWFAWNSCQKQEGAYNFNTYLTREMMRARRDYYKELATPSGPAGTVSLDHIYDLAEPQDFPRAVERRDLVKCLLQQINPEDREIVINYYMDGQTLKTIAEEKKVSISTVFQRIQEAMKIMRTYAQVRNLSL